MLQDHEEAKGEASDTEAQHKPILAHKYWSDI